MAIDAGYTITPLSGSGIQVQYSADEETWHATFTDGDVYMRQKVDGGNWTDPIKIVGEDGKNAIPMTSATTPSGEYEGQVGIWQNQIYFWTNGEWVNQTPELPTDAVLHYSFDDVPDLPDGTAIYKKNNDFTDTSGWAGNATASVSNGKMELSATAGQYKCYTVNIPANSIITVKGIGTVNGSVYLQVKHSGASADTSLKQIILRKGEYFEASVVVDANSINCSFYINLAWGMIISQFYIGDGSYSTPIIDNANGQNNATNNGGIAMQGVSGKGAYFLDGKYASIPNFNLNSNFSVSIWVKPDNNTGGLFGNIFFKSSQFIIRNGASWGDYLMIYLYGEGSTLLNVQNIGTLLTPNVWTHLVVIRKGTSCKVYRNGLITHLFTLANSTLRQNANTTNISTDNNTRPQILDDLLIFDRALSAKEVLALYQNKANTPKYFDLSDYSLEQIDDDNVVDHLTEKPQLLSKWLEIYNAKNVSSALPTSNVSTNGEYKGVINTANEVGVISTEQLENYIQATNALRSALWGTNGYLVDMNTDSTLNGNLDTLFANYRETLQIARTQITQQQASIASALSVINSNPFQLIPVNSQGEVITGGYDNTGTRLQVYNGTTVLTPKSASSTLSNGEWKVTANGSGIVAGSQTVGTGDDKYIDFGNVSNLSAETAVITYTINVMLNNTPNTIYVVQKFGKSKEGADGRIYTLLPDFTAVKKSADGSLLTPSSVTVQAKSWTGSSIPEPYNDGDLKAFENNVQVGTTVHGNSITVTPTGNYPVVVNLYRHGTNTLIDTVTIPILQEVKGDTGRGLQSETSYYKLSANLTETFDSTTISTWTDSADSTPTAQKPYLHCAVLSEYTEAPTNVYGDDVIIREYVTNGTNGTSTRYSSASATSSTTTIALNTITGNTAVVGDVIIANSLLFVVTAVGSTNATVQYKQSLKGADNKSVTVLLSNQNPNVTSNSDGSSPVLTNTVTDIRVYENETELKYDASSTSNGYYKVTVTASGCTHSSITDKGDYAQVNAISAMSADNATRTFAISGKRSDGTTFSFSAVQTITKSKKGNKGDNGVGITAVTEYYLRNNSSTAPTFDESTLSNWSTTASNPISTAQYLWNAERITKSDGTTTTYEYMTPHLAMKYTADGTDGKGIVSIKNYYLASSLDSGVTTDTQGWTEAVQTVSSTNRYLWNYEEITYTTGDPTKTSPAIIGTFGAVSQGNWTPSHSYKVSDIVYYQGSSYICKTAHTSGSTFDSSKWNKLADKGGDGIGVTSVIAYTALSTDTTKPAQSEFTTTAKSVDSTNRCLWRYEVTTYTDTSTTGSYADATIIGVWGNSGIDATAVSISSEQIEVMCGNGNGKFLGSQAQRIIVYARKGSAKKACTLSFTSPASGTGITITKQDGTASADGYFDITFADNGNLGGDSTNSYDLSLTVTVDTIPFVFTVKAIKASKGVYLGRCASKPSTATVTVYTGDTWNGSSVTKYALKGDYVSVVNMTESDSNRGKMFQWNGLQWNEDGNTGHAMEALDDMLLMADTLPDGSRATKFLDRLITNEVLAKRMTSLEVMFKEFVASFKGSNYEQGDLSISMGKNPKNLYDDNLNFNIQSFLAMLPKSSTSSENSEMWRKEFYTEYDDVYKKTDLVTKGDISLGGALKTFNTVYSGANVEEQPFIYPDSFTSNDTVVFSVRQDMLRMFRCSNGTIYVYIGVLPSVQDQLAFSLSYTWNGNINQIYDIYQTYTEGQGFTEYISTSEGVYRYKDTESERFSLVVDKVFFRMNPYKGKVICWDDASEESFLFDGTNLTQIDVIGDVFVEFTENLYVGYAKYSTNPIIEFYNCNEDGFNRVGYNNLQGKPIYNIDAYTHKRGNSAGSINKNNIYGLYAVNGKLYLSYDTTVTAGKACMILRSNDCGNTWDIISSVISTSSTSTNSSRFLFGYNKDGLIVLCGSGTYSYSTNNGEKFTIKTVALSSWKWIGRSIEDFGQNSRDILIPYWSSGLKFKKLINVNTAEIFKKNISNQKGNLIKFRNGDGFVIQWGQTENLGNASSGVTKTASISLNNRPFFNNNYSVFVTLEGSTSGLELAVKDKTRFGFTITGYNRNSSTPVNDVVFHWLAIGNTDK